MDSINILLIEDNEGDILLTVEALQESELAKKIVVKRDGQEAIDYLNKKGEYSGAVTPNLILLDINLPKVNGHELLEKIKQDEALKAIPVVMLSTSSSSEDILKCYKSFASCYITKPVDIESFTQVIKNIEEFWASTVELPKTN